MHLRTLIMITIIPARRQGLRYSTGNNSFVSELNKFTSTLGNQTTEDRKRRCQPEWTLIENLKATHDSFKRNDTRIREILKDVSQCCNKRHEECRYMVNEKDRKCSQTLNEKDRTCSQIISQKQRKFRIAVNKHEQEYDTKLKRELKRKFDLEYPRRLKELVDLRGHVQKQNKKISEKTTQIQMKNSEIKQCQLSMDQKDLEIVACNDEKQNRALTCEKVLVETTDKAKKYQEQLRSNSQSFQTLTGRLQKTVRQIESLHRERDELARTNAEKIVRLERQFFISNRNLTQSLSEVSRLQQYLNDTRRLLAGNTTVLKDYQAKLEQTLVDLNQYKNISNRAASNLAECERILKSKKQIISSLKEQKANLTDTLRLSSNDNQLRLEEINKVRKELEQLRESSRIAIIQKDTTIQWLSIIFCMVGLLSIALGCKIVLMYRMAAETTSEGSTDTTTPLVTQ